VEVGSGTPTTGVFSNINWAATAPKYIQTEIDLGSGFLDLGASKLLSVPYALYSLNPGPKGATGPAGANGATGANGAIGATGPAGVNGVT
ncbi:hypothetical protein ACI4A6_28345, partial [Klebsiella pneumoniae]